MDENFKIGARLEIFRDNNNFLVQGFPGYFDDVNVQRGFADPSAIVAGPQIGERPILV